MVNDEELNNIVEQMRRHDAMADAEDIIFKSKNKYNVYIPIFILAMGALAIGLLVGIHCATHDIQHYIKTTTDNSTVILNTIINIRA